MAYCTWCARSCNGLLDYSYPNSFFVFFSLGFISWLFLLFCVACVFNRSFHPSTSSTTSVRAGSSILPGIKIRALWLLYFDATTQARTTAVHRYTAVRAILTLLKPQSRFGNKPLKFQVVCPLNGTAVLNGEILFYDTPPIRSSFDLIWI